MPKKKPDGPLPADLDVEAFFRSVLAPRPSSGADGRVLATAFVAEAGEALRDLAGPPDAVLAGIDLVAFFGAILAPTPSADRDVLAAARDLSTQAEADARAELPRGDRAAATRRAKKTAKAFLRSPTAIAQFWEAHAPTAWIDRRPPAPQLFLARGRAPRRTLEGPAPYFRSFDAPTSIELAAALANDPGGVARCEELAREIIERMVVWNGPDTTPHRIAWCLKGPGRSGYGWRNEAESQVERIAAPARECLRRGARGSDIWLRWVADRVMPKIRQASGLLNARGEMSAVVLPNDSAIAGARLAARKSAVELLEEWVDYRLCLLLGATAELPDGRYPPFSELPDVLDPMLMVMGLGYDVEWIDSNYLVLSAPWSGQLLSADTWQQFYVSKRDAAGE